MGPNNLFFINSNKLEYKAEAKESGKDFYIEGLISTGDKDLVNDVCTKACLDGMFQQLDTRTIKLDFEHESMVGNSEIHMQIAKTKSPLGKRIKYQRTAKGVEVGFQLNPDWKSVNSSGKIIKTFEEVWREIKGGFFDAFSIAYIPMKTGITALKDGSEVRLLESVNLLNVALTGNPVNPAASMTSVMAKSLDFVKSQENKSNEVNNMVEDEVKSPLVEEEKPKEEAPVEEAPAEEEKPAEEVPAEPEPAPEEPVAEPAPEPVAEPEAEAKSSDDLVEIKSQIKALQKENEELKAIVEKAQIKSMGPQKGDSEAKSADSAPKLIGPLDRI